MGAEKRGRINLVTPEEGENIIADYFNKVKTHDFGVALLSKDKQEPYFTTINPLLPDSDGGLWWQASVDCIGLHCFINIQLRNGLVVFPLCLVSPRHRSFASLVAETTRIKRYNERKATILIANKMPESYPITFSAENLCIALVTSEFFPPEDLLRWKSSHCPACMEEIVVQARKNEAES